MAAGERLGPVQRSVRKCRSLRLTMSQDNRSKIGLIFVKFDIFSQNTVIYTGNYAKTDFPVKTSLMWGLDYFICVFVYVSFRK